MSGQRTCNEKESLADEPIVNSDGTEKPVETTV